MSKGILKQKKNYSEVLGCSYNPEMVWSCTGLTNLFLSCPFCAYSEENHIAQYNYHTQRKQACLLVFINYERGNLG